MTTYTVLLTGNESAWAGMSEDQQADVFERHEKFAALLEARGHQLTGGQELTPSAETKTLTKSDGRISITDGPYAESVEQLGAFYTVESDDIDDLLEICQVLAEPDGAIEVRAAVDHSEEAAG
ncbi:MAG: YciI family protein [Actinomycetales bacterium]